MKKVILIAGGILLILIAGGIWAYLFILGTPKEGENIFSNFGFGNDNIPVATDQNSSIVDTSPQNQAGALQRLRQLTTRPVAGATFIDGGIRYAERGTGHIYDIMFSTGNETPFSSVTTPRIVDAIFSSDGNRVALVSENRNAQDVYINSLLRNDQGTVQLNGVPLPRSVREVSFSDSGESVYYLEDTNEGVAGKAYLFAKETTTTLFSIPLRAVEILWDDPFYVYTTPTAEQRGYAYALEDNILTPSFSSGNGLMAMTYDEGVVVSTSDNNGILSVAHENGEEFVLPISLLPEKCVDDPHATSTLYCAAPFQMQPAMYPDAWYKGTLALSDALWKIDIANTEATLISNFLSESGREIDVLKIGADSSGKYLYFINKNDDTLWLYDLTL